MIGVVLSGGQSSRMCSDKGLLKYRSKTWAQIAFDKLNELQLPVFISINRDQQKEYSAIFSTQVLMADDEALQKKGPLGATLSIHSKHPLEDLLLLACDMPLMETGLLKELLIQYGLHPNYDAFVFINDGEPEPLCGIYKSKCLNKILHFYQTDQLSGQSMKNVLEQNNTFSIPVPDDKRKCFQNFNTQSELNKLS